MLVKKCMTMLYVNIKKDLNVQINGGLPLMQMIILHNLDNILVVVLIKMYRNS